MADLKDAIAGLRRVTPENDPWQRGDLGGGGSPVDDHIATILNAVLSGDIIPRADAELAVAEAIRRAADACVDLADQVSDAALTGLPEQARLRESMAAAFTKASHIILALAPADALAEVQRLRDERDGLLRAAHDNHEADKRAEAAEAERDAALAEVQRLREALAWYGEQSRLARLIHKDGDAGRNAIAADGGKRARAALDGDARHG